MVLKRLTILLCLVASTAWSATLTIQETSTTHAMEDTHLRLTGELTYNYGGSTTLTTEWDYVNGQVRSILFKFLNWDTLSTLDATNLLDSCDVAFYVSGITDGPDANDSLHMRVMWKPWYEGTHATGQATCGTSVGSSRFYEGGFCEEPPDSTWGGECAMYWSDETGFNTAIGGNDETGADHDARNSVSAAAELPNATNWVTFKFRTSAQVAYIDSLIDGTITNRGWVIIPNGAGSGTDALFTISSTENATTANRPIITMYYTTPSTATGGRRRRLLLGGE